MQYFSKLSKSYTEFVTPSEKGAYPIVDRIISYGLPTAVAVLWSVLGTHDKVQLPGFEGESNYNLFNKTHSDIGLSLGLGFYALSQVSLTYAKPLVEVKEEDSSFDKGWKKIAAGGIEVLDILNDVVPCTIAGNMLPDTYGLSEVAAWIVLPAIIKGVESDITAAVNRKVNGKTYTQTFAGDIFSSTIAGFVSVNIRDFLSEQVLGNDLYTKFNRYESLETDEIMKLNLKVFTESLVEHFSYPLIKKLFMKTSYKKNQIEQDILKGFMKNIFANSSLGRYEPTISRGTVFEGILKLSAAGLVSKALAYTSECIAEFEIHCDEYPELCESSISVANIQTESA